MKYYIPIKRFSLRYKFYAYVDVERYCADTLFAQNGVHCYFMREFGKTDSDVRVVFVKFPKAEEAQFLKAANKIEDSFVLKGIDIDTKIGNLKQVFANYWEGRDDGTGSC